MWHERHEMEIEQRGEQTWEIRGIANNMMTGCLGVRPKSDREIKSMNPAPNLKKFKDPDPESTTVSSKLES